MEYAQITDPLFRQAVEAIDTGDITLLAQLVAQHSTLATSRLAYPNGNYFTDPYLLWFVAYNPMRAARVPPNIAQITGLLVQQVQGQSPQNAQYQLDYALELVQTGSALRDSGLQIQVMDVLIDAGATPHGVLDAFAQGNVDAAKHLLGRGGQLNLAAAVCLNDLKAVHKLVPRSTPNDLLTALTAAAFTGNIGLTTYLLQVGAPVNGYPPAQSGFHHHATPLHQAVAAGSLEIVKLLVKAGANQNAADKVYSGTPLGWAEYLPTVEGCDASAKSKFEAIADYLRSVTNDSGDK
jgi:hypothetical protein